MGIIDPLYYERTEKIMAERETYLDKIKGGLIGGAIGDALGYPVEFMNWEEIKKEYKDGGIQEYTLDFDAGVAVISDDTQMSLFTANGILIGETNSLLYGDRRSVSNYVYDAYLEWLKTQNWTIDRDFKNSCWLYDIPDMHCRRAPGNTCLSALRSGEMGSVESPINLSKGCGGVMRVAPLALHYKPVSEEELRMLDYKGAQIAAITHGNPLGYIPAAILTHIISIGVYGEKGLTLREAVNEAWDTVHDLFRDRVDEEYLSAMDILLTKAISLAETPGEDEKHIKAIGDGWTGDEALAIAIYCSLRYPDDFSKAVIAAVNHDGDSDSTGAVTGNILGAWLGYEAIDEKWKRNLEMKGILLTMAEDLCYGCWMVQGDDFVDEAWVRRYCEGRAQ